MYFISSLILKFVKEGIGNSFEKFENDEILNCKMWIM